VTPRAVESKPAFVRVNGEVGDVYNEAAFRYFLALAFEKIRAERSVRPLLLLLVKLRKPSKHQDEASVHRSSTIFSALRACVREMDFVGWYREGRVAAAVLAASGAASENVRHQLKVRVVRVLTQKFPADEAGRLEVRVVDVGHKPRM
jgi:hypothetical protein